jgi:hypothetical protein
MTAIDEWVDGPMYLVLIYAFLKRRNGAAISTP